MSHLFSYRSWFSPISSFQVSGLKAEPIHWPQDFPELEESKDSGVVAMNCINQIKYFFRNPETATKERLDGLWHEVKRLEWMSVGNNRLEKKCALYMAAAFFQDERMQRKSSRRLYREAFDHSPEFVLELLLDCINVGERMGVNGTKIRELVKPFIPMSGSVHNYAERLYIIIPGK